MLWFQLLWWLSILLADSARWPVLLLLSAISCVGFIMLFSVSGGDIDRWAQPQMKRFFIGMTGLIAVAMVPIRFWRGMALPAYLFGIALLIWVQLFGVTVNGAARWIEIGSTRLQPSEVMKIALILMLAAFYDWLPVEKASRPLWVIVALVIILLPVALILKQPDLGTSLLLVMGGGAMMLVAGVHWLYFAGLFATAGGLVAAVFLGRDTPWQLLKNYQYDRIDVLLNPGSDALGKGYNIIQAQIALGSGGWSGRGFMQGTQSRLNFLPEKHTDFIFTILAEEFGFVGTISLLVLYSLVLVFCIASAMGSRDRFGALLTMGIGATFFLFFSVNMAMVMGMIPVVGVPLPLVSYGGTAMMILLLGFGLMQSAHVHRPRTKS
ncbi:MAG: rod shape-determining protein RodA [Planktomarina sp.]